MSKDTRGHELQLVTVLDKIKAAGDGDARRGKATSEQPLFARFAERYVNLASTAAIYDQPLDNLIEDVRQAWRCVFTKRSSRPVIAFDDGQAVEHGRGIPGSGAYSRGACTATRRSAAGSCYGDGCFTGIKAALLSVRRNFI